MLYADGEMPPDLMRARCEGLQASNAIGYASQYSRSHDAVIRVYDDSGNVIETHEHAGEFKEW